MKKTALVMIAGLLILITACSGGGGGVTLTKATVTLASSGTGTIYGIDVTLNLPDGVTVKSSNPPIPDAGVVTTSGAAEDGTLSASVFTAATGTFPATVRVLIVSASGFATGEYCTIHCDIAPGHSPTATDFGIASFAASDTGGTITTVASGFTADIY